MDAEVKFKRELDEYLKDDSKCQGVVLPTKFGLITQSCNSIIAKSGNIGIVKLEKIYREFVNINVNLWNMFSLEDSINMYRMIAYINTRLRFYTNYVRITKDMFDGFIGKVSNKRSYLDTINKLINRNVIERTTAYRDIYIVNPVYLFKGNLYIFKELCDKYQMFSSTIDERGRIIVDKALVIKDIKEKEVEVLINKKYIKAGKEKEEKIKMMPKLKLKI